MAERHSQGFFDALKKETKPMFSYCCGCSKEVFGFDYCNDCVAAFKTKEMPPCPNCKSPDYIICEKIFIEETAVTDKEARAILAKQKELWKQTEKETAVTPTPDDSELRIRIYREAWADAERENARLREENERLRIVNAQVTDRFNLIIKDRDKLTQEKIVLEQHKARYQEEILELEKEVMQLRTIEGDQIAEILYLEGRMEAVRAMLADAIGELKVD